MGNKQNVSSVLAFINDLKAKYTIEEIEGSLVAFFLENNKVPVAMVKDRFIQQILGKGNHKLKGLLSRMYPSMDLEMLADAFEAMVEPSVKRENGVVFTPMYVVNYICENAFEQCYLRKGQLESTKQQEKVYSHTTKIIDPACGCGIFLLGALLLIHKKTGLPKRHIIERSLYGLDLDEQNARRCKIVLAVACLLDGDYSGDIDFNIHQANSLETDWNQIFDVEGFHYIIGNPPYVSTHDMASDMAQFLKHNFITVQAGVSNLFYAFVEQSMKFLREDGCLCFIVPNNFLTIRSAENLRSYIQRNKYLRLIVDFGENMVFKPVKTYSAALMLDKKRNDIFHYGILHKSDNIEEQLFTHEVHKMDINKLDKQGWKLISQRALDNIRRIEGQHKSIKEFIRTGIATLKDKVYIIDCRDENGYYQEANGEKFYIERCLIRTLYKISSIRANEDIENFKKHIIFPYEKGKKGFKIIPERKMKESYPLCYAYFLAMKDELDKRDKGKPNPAAWYAYGRPQNLNRYGRKLIFPVFSQKPKFILEEDETALFCNGYGIFENDYMDLEILMKILNSIIMEYYIHHTSYSIEGGYRCYQKRYIENFSIPKFSEEELTYLREQKDKETIDQFLMEKYGLWPDHVLATIE